MQVKELVTVQIGKIDTIKKRISLIPPYKKNVNVAVEVKGIDKEKFLDSVEINGKVCDSYRECTDNYNISDAEIRKVIAESYEKAVDEDTILMYNEAFTFHIKGKTKYGGALAAGGVKKPLRWKRVVCEFYWIIFKISFKCD